MTHSSVAGMKRFAIAFLALTLAAGCEPSDERAQARMDSAKELLASGDTARAMVELREAIRLNPNLAEAYVAIAELAQNEGNLKSAVGHYAKAVEIDETNVPARIRLGRIMLAAGQLDDALRYAMAAAQLAPEDPDALTLRASVAVQVENFDLATESANQALEVAPDMTDAKLVLAVLDQRRGDIDAALAKIEAALEADPKHLAGNLFKLRMLEEKKDEAGVSEILHDLVEYFPERPQFRTALVRWQLRKGDKDAAEKTLRAHADQNPDDVKAALTVAQFLLSQRDGAAARAELERQLQARSGDDAYDFEIALVRLDIAERKPDGAIGRLRDMVAKYGDTQNGDAARVQLASMLANGDDEAKMQAKGLVDDVLKHDARNGQALALRAQFKLQADRYDAAIQDIRLAVAEEPENWRFLMLEAKAHELNGAQTLASERLATAAKVSDYAPTPVLAYARQLQMTGKGDFAEGLIENALRNHPNDGRLLRALAQIKLAKQDWIGAEEIARQLAQSEDGKATADYITAQSLAGRDQKEQSIAVLENMYKDGSKSGSGMAALVASYLRAEQPEKARAFLEEVLSDSPDNLAALKLKADFHLSQGEKADAEAAYRKLIELAPENGAAYNVLAQFLTREQRFDEAVAVAKAGAGKSNDSALKLTLALLLERKGDIAGAIDVYQDLYEVQPESFVIANNLASLLTEHFPTAENIERAYVVAKRLRSSDRPHYQDTYGWLLYLRGEPDQALRFLKPAAEQLPQVMLAQFHLGMAYAKAGINDRAIETLTRALELRASEAHASQVAEARRTLEELKAAAAKAN